MIYFKKKELLLTSIIHIVMVSLILWYYYKSDYAFSLQETNTNMKDLLVVNVNIKMYKKWKIKMYNLGSTIHQLSYHQ